MANPSLEERVAELERKVERIASEKQESESEIPWWERWSGAFRDNEHFDLAIKLGAEYRSSQPTADEDTLHSDTIL